MRDLLRVEVKGSLARVTHSTRADGDLSPSAVAADVLADRRQSILDRPWHVVRQVHGDRVVEARTTEPVEPRPEADALVTSRVDVGLAVHGGDCIPIGFVHSNGVVAATHAGWRGLEVGVIESTVRSLRATGGSGIIHAAVGPHIRAAQYEFGLDDLERMTHRFGPAVRASTTTGAPAFDLTAALAGELDRVGIDSVTWSDGCTATDGDLYWSHRARGESGRLALVVWMEAQ